MMIKYRQTKIQDEDLYATRVALKIGSKWIDGILLDKDSNVLPLPHEVKAGERYTIEVDDA